MTGAASILSELLADCDAHGIRLFPASDGGLTIDAPDDALTPELLAQLRVAKAELLALLAAQEGQKSQDCQVRQVHKVPGNVGAPPSWQTPSPRDLANAHAALDAFATPEAPGLLRPMTTKAVCSCGCPTWLDVVSGRECGRCGAPWDTSPLNSPQAAPSPAPTAGACRCGCMTWTDVAIHGGGSTRRDCAACGRFREYVRWHGRRFNN